MRRLGLLGVALAMLGSGCADISSPNRTDVYEWRLFVGDDPISFHWPESRLPVRIWVQDEFGMPAKIQAGAEKWRRAFLYNEWRYEITDDQANADIIVSTDPPDPGVRTIRLGSMLAPECNGATDLDIPFENPTVITLPIRVYVYPRFDPETPGFDECMALTATHELGHAMGIFQHAPEESDIMFGDPVVSDPSAADLATMEVLYHSQNTIQVIGGTPE